MSSFATPSAPPSAVSAGPAPRAPPPPIGRFGGSLAKVRADDLAAAPIKALKERNPNVAWDAIDEVFFGCANQAGEDNRNVARMAALLAGLPESVPGQT